MRPCQEPFTLRSRRHGSIRPRTCTIPVIVGTSAVAKAEPDGYTVLITTLAHPINMSLHRKLPYDSIGDFEPVALMEQAVLAASTLAAGSSMFP